MYIHIFLLVDSIKLFHFRSVPVCCLIFFILSVSDKNNEPKHIIFIKSGFIDFVSKMPYFIRIILASSLINNVVCVSIMFVYVLPSELE